MGGSRGGGEQDSCVKGFASRLAHVISVLTFPFSIMDNIKEKI